MSLAEGLRAGPIIVPVGAARNTNGGPVYIPVPDLASAQAAQQAYTPDDGVNLTAATVTVAGKTWPLPPFLHARMRRLCGDAVRLGCEAEARSTLLTLGLTPRTRTRSPKASEPPHVTPRPTRRPRQSRTPRPPATPDSLLGGEEGPADQ